MPRTVLGSCGSSRNAASAQAGAVLRAAGSLRIWGRIDGRHLAGDRLVEQLVGDDPNVARIRDWQQAVQRLLDHGLVAIECEHLLGAGAAAPRPETGAAASRQDYRGKAR